MVPKAGLRGATTSFGRIVLNTDKSRTRTLHLRVRRFSDGMRRPVSRGMRYAPNVSTCSKHKEKETGNAED
jgi:hypothetical protein